MLMLMPMQMLLLMLMLMQMRMLMLMQMLMLMPMIQEINDLGRPWPMIPPDRSAPGSGRNIRITNI